MTDLASVHFLGQAFIDVVTELIGEDVVDDEDVFEDDLKAKVLGFGRILFSLNMMEIPMIMEMATIPRNTILFLFFQNRSSEL